MSFATLAGLVAGTPAGATAPTAVSVTLKNTTIVVAPGLVPTGPVVFKVANRSSRPRDFRILGKRTPQIAAGRSATMAVTLSGGGSRVFSSVGGRQSPRLTGLLDVFEPCTAPAASTVNVQLAQDRGGLTISQAAVPCGTVTFLVTNDGTLTDSLQIFSQAPAVAGSTPELQPGQTAKVTLRFPAKGLVYYQSGDFPPAEPEFGGDYNEGGQLSLD
jgi:hypothetical protein